MLTFLSVNWWAVIVSAVIEMIIGMVWFSPALFGKAWMSAHGIDPNNEQAVKEMRKAQGPIFPVMLIATLVSTYILAIVLKNLNAVSAGSGIGIAFWLWLGFMAPYILGSVLISRMKKSMIWAEWGHTLIGMLISGWILAVWR